MGKVLGIDVGGTFIKAAAITETGTMTAKLEWPTEAAEGTEALLDRLGAIARATAEEAGWQWSEVTGAGIGLPAFLDFESGIVEEAVNLGWKNVHIVDEMKKRLAVPVYFDNDANVAALGEAWLGGGRGHRHILMVTLGTGVGGGVVIDGRIYRGANGMAGEVGHIVLEPVQGERCNCGQIGCLETISSASAILRAARKRLQQGEESSLQAIDSPTTKDVFAHAVAGDSLAREVVDHAIHRLGYALAIIGNTLNPEVIVIGGGPSKAGDILYKPLREYFAKYALKRVAASAVIRPAELGNDAGIIGAAKLALGQVD